MAAKDEQGGPLRVMLWSNPRTLSTVFLKCMSFVEGTQAINEPYAVARGAGPDASLPTDPTLLADLTKFLEDSDAKLAKVKMDLPKAFNKMDCTFKWVKETLEAPFSAYKLVFCKDQAFGIHGRFDMLPKGYQHTFLIRDPYKLYPSWRNVIVNMVPAAFRQLDIFKPTKFGLGEMYDLVQHVTEKLNQTPVIIDADDLQNNPVSIMRQYCEAIGVPFKESMLTWEAGDSITKDWIACDTFIRGNKLESGGYYDEALKSTCFHPNKPLRNKELPEDVLACIDRVMPAYKKMYEMRLRP